VAKVVSAEAFQVDVPVETLRTDAVQQFVKQETVFVEITTDDGATGLGYAYTIGTGGSSVLALLKDHLLSRLIGKDARRIEHIWQDLFALANFGVAARPGYRLDDAGLPPAVAAELAQRRASFDDVRASPAGKVCVAHTLAVDISATAVRAALHATQRTDKVPHLSALVAPQVLDYIQQHNLYKN